MVKKRKSKINYILLIVISILVLWGIFTLGTSSFPISLKHFNTAWYYLFHQLFMLGIGIILGVVAFFIPLEKLKKIAPYLFLFTLFLLLLVFIPGFGIKAKGASRWLNFRIFSLQPSEFLKITFILYLSAWLSERRKVDKRKGLNQMLLPFSAILSVLGLILILQPDMTTLVVIAAIGLLMYFFSQAPIWHTLSVVGVGFLGVIVMILKAPYRLQRLTTFLNPSLDPLGSGYQLKQASVSIGSGKLFGIGKGFSLGMSQQKFGFLPEATTDSIFAIIAEELGFFGGLILLFLFLFLCYQGLKIAFKTEGFASFLALGITFWITIQALANIGGIVGIMPLGGIPLPFFSYGGSHIIAEMIGMGILLNISRNT